MVDGLVRLGLYLVIAVVLCAIAFAALESGLIALVQIGWSAGELGDGKGFIVSALTGYAYPLLILMAVELPLMFVWTRNAVRRSSDHGFIEIVRSAAGKRQIKIRMGLGLLGALFVLFAFPHPVTAIALVLVFLMWLSILSACVFAYLTADQVARSVVRQR